MAPRLSHKKTRTGCLRCKVKCDEEKPKCGACSRHNVTCEYPISPYENQGVANGHSSDAAEHLMELRLMHEWMAFACESFATTGEFWKHQAPLIAFEFRHVLDAMLALSALHASRAKPRIWSSLEGRMVDIPAGVNSAGDELLVSEAALESGWKAATRARKAVIGMPLPNSIIRMQASDRGDTLEISRKYFARAIEGHQQAMVNLTVENVRAAYMSSILICCYSLFTLNEATEESLMLDPIQWFRLSRGTVIIVDHWQRLVGDKWFIEAGGMYGEPDLSDNDELFHPRHREGFEYLLDPIDGDEIADEDREAYEHTLSYIGLLYKGIVQELDAPLATSRRVIAMPARVPIRFCELVEAGRPRAVAFLVHVFAFMKLAEHKFSWFQGIAQRQLPILCDSLPGPWLDVVQWPSQVVRDDVVMVSSELTPYAVG